MFICSIMKALFYALTLMILQARCPQEYSTFRGMQSNLQTLSSLTCFVVTGLIVPLRGQDWNRIGSIHQKRDEMQDKSEPSYDTANTVTSERELWTDWLENYKWPIQDLVEKIPEARGKLKNVKQQIREWSRKLDVADIVGVKDAKSEGWTVEEIMGFIKRERSLHSQSSFEIYAAQQKIKKFQKGAKERFLDSGLVPEESELRKEIMDVLAIDPVQL